MKFTEIVLEHVNSTNSYAKHLLNESKAGEGTIIRAWEQYAGRGQGENSWHSQPGMNLTFSLVLEPFFLLPDKQFSLNKAVALAVSNSVGKELPSGITTSVKWPNDIYAGDRKIAGILIEHCILGSSIKNSVVGIGINLNQQEFPATLPNPVSLKQLTGKDYDAKKILERTCKNLDSEYFSLINREFQAIDNEYNSSLFGYGRDFEFTAGESSFTGRIQGVDDLGRLIVMTADGVIRKFNHGEITGCTVSQTSRSHKQ